MSRLDIGPIAPADEKPAQVAREHDDEPHTWSVSVLDEWIATWSTRAEAEEHARRINAALEWDGKESGR